MISALTAYLKTLYERSTTSQHIVSNILHRIRLYILQYFRIIKIFISEFADQLFIYFFFLIGR